MTNKTPKHWHEPAHTLWLAEQRQAAVKSVIDKLNEDIKNKVAQSLLGHYYIQAGFYLYLLKDYAGSVAMSQKAVEIFPDDVEQQQNLIVCMQKAKQYQACADYAEKLIANGQQQNHMLYDVLALTYWHLCKTEQAKQAGTQSLIIKHTHSTQLPADIAHKWQKKLAISVDTYLNTKTKKQSVIAFSLFGNNTRYLHGAIRNLSLAADIYPNWQVWIYVDDNVPADYLALFERMGAVLKMQPSQQSMREKLCWRFQVANDAAVGRFLVRDIDSVINVREKIAVDAWFVSGKYFHVMRDWWSHTDLVLAGMWGGVAGMLPPVQPLLETYRSGFLETPNIDQMFLKDVLWAYLKHSVCIHDRYFDLTDTQLKLHSSNPWQAADTIAHQEMNRPLYFNETGVAEVDDLHIGCCEHSIRKSFQDNKVAPYLSSINALLAEKTNSVAQAAVSQDVVQPEQSGKITGKIDLSKINKDNPDALKNALMQALNTKK